MTVPNNSELQEVVVVDIQNNNSNSGKEKKKRRFRKKKIVEEEIKDPREPNITLFSHLHIPKVIGWNWILIFFSCIGAMGTGVIPLCFQFVLGDMIDTFGNPTSTKEELRDSINWIAAQFAIIAAGGCIGQGMFHFFSNLSYERVGVNLREAYMNTLIEQEMTFFDIKKIGALTIAISEDIPKLQDIYTKKIAEYFKQITQFIVGVVLALVACWQMSLVMISTTPLILLTITIVASVISVLTKKINSTTEHSGSVSNEIISSMRTIRSMAGEDKEKVRYRKDLTKINIYGFIKSALFGGAFMIVDFILWGTIALAFWYGGGLIIDGSYTMGAVFKVFGMLIFAVMGVGAAAAFLPEIAKARVSQTTLLKVLLRKPLMPYKGGKQPSQVIGEIRLENVTFAYPSRPNITVMKDFSLTVEPGTSVALVGPSGSGKSTIVGLMERFYEPLSGKIYLDGIELSEIDPMWLHKHVGIVTQEPILFATTIKENIAYAVGIENVTQEQIEKAAMAANAHNFIIDLPDGYNTLLGEKGVSLSGGQKQRIAIARALLQDPKILLLDEATSALDTESEALVQAALDILMKGRTTICIAHRLSTVINSNQICVLVKGVMKEKGTHSELIQIPNGIYKKLAERQMALKEEEELMEEEEEEVEIVE